MQCSAGQFVINISLLCHCWRRVASLSVCWRSHFCKLWRGVDTDALSHRLSAVVALLQTLTRSVWKLDFSYFDIINISYLEKMHWCQNWRTPSVPFVWQFMTQVSAWHQIPGSPLLALVLRISSPVDTSDITTVPDTLFTISRYLHRYIYLYPVSTVHWPQSISNLC